MIGDLPTYKLTQFNDYCYTCKRINQECFFTEFDEGLYGYLCTGCLSEECQDEDDCVHIKVIH